MTHATLKIEGLLLDLDGTLYVDDQLIPGARETIEWLVDHRLPFRYVTNTTTKSLATLSAKLESLGLPADEKLIITAPYAAVLFLRSKSGPSVHLLLNDDATKDFTEFEVSEKPDYLVIGDIGDAWSYDIMNGAFGMVMNGAKMIALHKGRYWQTGAGLQLDIGAFVAGLEYTTGSEAMIMGKPAPAFFQMAAKSLELEPSSIAMIGDDLISDVGGAQSAGMKGILVKTGKYRKETALQSSVKPDAVLQSIADLQRIL